MIQPIEAMPYIEISSFSTSIESNSKMKEILDF